MPRKKSHLPSIPTVLKLLDEAGDSLDLSQLAQDVLQEFGGTKGFAKKCFEYFNSVTSATAKGRMLEAVMRLLSFATPKDKDPLEGLANSQTPDLEQLLAKLLQPAVTPPPPTPPPALPGGAAAV